MVTGKQKGRLKYETFGNTNIYSELLRQNPIDLGGDGLLDEET